MRTRPTAWLITGSAGAAVLGLIPLGFGEYGLWAVAPAMMVVIVAAFTSTRRRRVLIAGATLGAAVPGTIVNLARGDDEVLYARRSRPGCCCSPPG